MAITHRSAATANTGNSTATSLTINKPAGVVEGDFLLAAVTVFGGVDTTITPPSGWTLVRRADQGTRTATASYYKLATASEPTSYTWGFSNPNATAVAAAGGISAYVGVDNASPVNASAGQVNGTASTSVVTPAVTTTVAAALVVRVHGLRVASDVPATLAPPTGNAERWEVSNAGSGTGAVSRTAEIADATQAAAGDTGAATATPDVSCTNASQTLVLTPAIELVGMVGI